MDAGDGWMLAAGESQISVLYVTRGIEILRLAAGTRCPIPTATLFGWVHYSDGCIILWLRHSAGSSLRGCVIRLARHCVVASFGWLVIA